MAEESVIHITMEAISMYQMLDAGQVFSGKKSGTMVGGFDAPTERTPKLRTDYMIAPWLRDVIMWFIHGDEPLYITGPTGCGKTSGLKQIAAMLNYPVYEITGHNRLETPELVGHFALQNGSTVWVDGPLTMAMREGGLFLLNEIDLLDPSTATGLNSVLDGSPLCIADTAEVVPPAAGFRFVGTANTNGSGDDAGVYVGTLRQNAAFQNRFLHIEADYLPPQAENVLLRNAAPNLPDSVYEIMQRMTATVRSILTGKEIEDSALAGFGGANLQVPISTRALLRWAYWTEKLEPMKRNGVNVLEKALDMSIANSCDSVSKNTLHELLQRIAGDA